MPSVVLDPKILVAGEKPAQMPSSNHLLKFNISDIDTYDAPPGFYATLTAPYEPPKSDSPGAERNMDASRESDPVKEEAMQDFCNAMVEDYPCDFSGDAWGVEVTEPAVGDISLSDQRRTLYTPHGKWAEAGLNPIEDWKVLAHLGAGSTCSANLRKGYLAGKPILYISKLWTLSHAKRWERFTSELALYKSSKHMKPLQGIVVPHVINVYTTPGHIEIGMELPHDCFWIEASPDMPTVLKDRCVAAFEKLHQHGILHGDVELRHILIGADCKVTIVDFQRSRSSDPIPEVDLQIATPDEFRMEMRRVRFKLDYDGARTKEHAKIRRAAEMAKKNKDIAQELKRCGGLGRPEDFVQPAEEDIVDPAVPKSLWSEEWIIACEAAPRRFVVPGRTSQDVQVAVESFLASITKMENMKERHHKSPDTTVVVADRTERIPRAQGYNFAEDPFLSQPRTRKRKRDMQPPNSESSSSDNEAYREPKRICLDALRPVVHTLEHSNRALSQPNMHSSYQIPTEIPSLVDTQKSAPRQKRKRARSWATVTGSMPQMTFSDFMLLSEIERERELARKKRKTSLTSITAECGSDCERSLSPPLVSPSPEADVSGTLFRRTSPCLSPEEAAIRIAMMSSSSYLGPIKPVIKPPPPIIVRDFAKIPYDGPKGYYVPHPPTENRIGLERTKHIRRRNALKCVKLGLQYPTVEDQYGDIVPEINPLPYTIQFEQERDRMARKRRNPRGFGSLTRKRNSEQLNDEERHEIALARHWEDAQDLGNMSKVRFLRPISVACDISQNELSSPHPVRGILKKPEPVKTFKYQEPWVQPSDEELSPKVGPTREELDRSGGFGMLGVKFQHDITTDEETSRRELLDRLRKSDTCRKDVEGIWWEEEKKMEEIRRRDSLEDVDVLTRRREIIPPSLGEAFRLVYPSPSHKELEEERLVEEMLIPTDDKD